MSTSHALTAPGSELVQLQVWFDITAKSLSNHSVQLKTPPLLCPAPVPTLPPPLPPHRWLWEFSWEPVKVTLQKKGFSFSPFVSLVWLSSVSKEHWWGGQEDKDEAKRMRKGRDCPGWTFMERFSVKAQYLSVEACSEQVTLPWVMRSKMFNSSNFIFTLNLCFPAPKTWEHLIWNAAC